VFIGFGSTMNTAEQAERMSEVIGRALRQAGVRGVVQAGWAGLEVVNDDTITIADVRHD
jgi:hypothetical protein